MFLLYYYLVSRCTCLDLVGKMKLLIGFAILALTNGRIIEEICDDVLVHNIHHVKEILAQNLDSPYQLAIDYDTNMLFFSYSNKVGSDLFSSAYINLKTNELNTIPGIKSGFANAVDDKKHIVYLGGGDGLYTFDFDAKIAKHIDGTHHNIWQMFYKNNLYYSTYPDEHVYVFKNGHIDRVPEIADTRAMLVALNKDLDFYFSNSSGLFKVNKSNGRVSDLGDYNINAFTADNNGNLYFSTPYNIYYVGENDNIEKIASLPNIYGVAIESDGSVIYASQDNIVRLKPTKTPCFVDEKKHSTVDMTNSINN